MFAPTEAATRQPAASRADRWLNAFTTVHPGEARGALRLAANVFCLLAAYYLLKTAREALILSEGTAEVKSYASAAQAALLFVIVPLYGAVASRVSRLRLVNGVLLFFACHLVVFEGLARAGYHLGVPFYLWVGVFNLVVVAQFWALANDAYTVERGERLFPIVATGASLGAWFGAQAAARAMAAHLQPSDLFVIALAGLLVCMALNRSTLSGRETTWTQKRDARLGKEGALRLVLDDRYLRLLALLVILVNVVNTTGEYLLGRLVSGQAAALVAVDAAGGLTKAQLIGRFYGEFFGWVNLGSLVVQLLLVSRIFRRIGVRGALFVLPVIACGSYLLFAFLPILGAIRLGKILENSTDYSLQNTARHALFLPTTAEAKYKAKQVIDGLCWRLGDILQAGIVFCGTTLHFGSREYALLNEVFVLAWFVVVWNIGRTHRLRSILAELEAAAA